jgi:glycosyltransferase involved in cell wall biosynthesis
MDRRARKTLASASALCSFTQSGLEWAWKKADRTGRPEDFWFPFTYRAEQSTEADLAPARAFWKRHEAFDTRYTFQVCFFGALSGRYNLEAVIDAAKQLGQRNAPISFLLCGEGEAGDQLRARASGAANVYFPGWVNGTQIRALMEVASVGILPYDNPDFLMSIPNKFVEYLAGGLPVVSCTGGEVKRLLETSGCGLWVRPDAASIAEGLAELAVNPDAVDKMHVRSRDVFKTTFEEGVVFSQALGRLEEIVRSHKTPRQDGAT